MRVKKEMTREQRKDFFQARPLRKKEAIAMKRKFNLRSKKGRRLRLLTNRAGEIFCVTTRDAEVKPGEIIKSVKKVEVSRLNNEKSRFEFFARGFLSKQPKRIEIHALRLGERFLEDESGKPLEKWSHRGITRIFAEEALRLARGEWKGVQSIEIGVGAKELMEHYERFGFKIGPDRTGRLSLKREQPETQKLNKT